MNKFLKLKHIGILGCILFMIASVLPNYIEKNPTPMEYDGLMITIVILIVLHIIGYIYSVLKNIKGLTIYTAIFLVFITAIGVIGIFEDLNSGDIIKLQYGFYVLIGSIILILTGLIFTLIEPSPKKETNKAIEKVIEKNWVKYLGIISSIIVFIGLFFPFADTTLSGENIIISGIDLIDLGIGFFLLIPFMVFSFKQKKNWSLILGIVNLFFLGKIVFSFAITGAIGEIAEEELIVKLLPGYFIILIGYLGTILNIILLMFKRKVKEVNKYEMY